MHSYDLIVCEMLWGSGIDVETELHKNGWGTQNKKCQLQMGATVATNRTHTIYSSFFLFHLYYAIDAMCYIQCLHFNLSGNERLSIAWFYFWCKQCEFMVLLPIYNGIGVWYAKQHAQLTLTHKRNMKQSAHQKPIVLQEFCMRAPVNSAHHCQNSKFV